MFKAIPTQKTMPKKKRTKFTSKTIHRKRIEHPLKYLQKKSSFWIAAMSLVAFVAGNMMGQHGWRAFWASVVGGYDDSLITYTGIVPPLALVPDYNRWVQYGGDPKEHTFRQVPQHLLVPLPHYDVREQRLAYHDALPGDVYSTGFMGSNDGAEGKGSHNGVDIRAPEGTPVQSMANGMVTQVRDSYGFGNIIVIRHPHMPDPQNPQEETVLYSTYAHLSSQFVSVGEVVTKGQKIGLTGSTGVVTGPHLHFQIDRDVAPWHPYWPFTGEEARDAGLTFAEAVDRGLNQGRGYQYSVHPMLYVQANYPPVGSVIASTQIVAQSGRSDTPPRETVVQTRKEQWQQRISRMLARRAERMRRRLDRRRFIAQVIPAKISTPAPESQKEEEPVIVSTETVAQAFDVEIPTKATVDVASVAFQHDGSFAGREWETVHIILLDEHGRTIESPNLPQDLYLKAAYGNAEFEPQKLSVLDFDHGEAEVKVLPRGRRTVVIQALPFGSISPPLRYER